MHFKLFSFLVLLGSFVGNGNSTSILTTIKSIGYNLEVYDDVVELKEVHVSMVNDTIEVILDSSQLSKMVPHCYHFNYSIDKLTFYFSSSLSA